MAKIFARSSAWCGPASTGPRGNGAQLNNRLALAATLPLQRVSSDGIDPSNLSRKSASPLRRLYSHPIDNSCDQTMVLTRPLTSQLTRKNCVGADIPSMHPRDVLIYPGRTPRKGSNYAENLSDRELCSANWFRMACACIGFHACHCRTDRLLGIR